MAYIILSSKRTRQPQGAVRVDWSNPLTRGLTHLWSPTGGLLRDQVGSWHLTAAANAAVRQTQYSGFDSAAGSDTFDIAGAPVSLGTAGNWWWFGLVRIDSDNISAFGPAGATYQYDGYVLGRWNGSGEFYSSCGDSVLASWTDTSVALGLWATYSVSFISGSTFPYLWINGANKGAASSQLSTKAPDVRRLSGISGYYFDGSVALSVLGTGKLDDAACVQELHRNPWQLFAPDPRRLWFAPSSGGATIFESTFADSWSLSDTYSASANLVSTYADSPTVIDSSSSSAVFSSAFDETIPVSDGPSADMGGTANRTQEESFTITDAYSANLTAVATVSETLSVEDSLSASAIFNATFAETLPIVDGEEADAGRISDIAENVTVTDAYTAGIIAQATQAESVTTIDTYDTIAIYNPALEETLPITDAVGATLTVPTSGTVDLSQESIDALALEIMNQLTSVPVRRL